MSIFVFFDSVIIYLIINIFIELRVFYDSILLNNYIYFGNLSKENVGLLILILMVNISFYIIYFIVYIEYVFLIYRINMS